MASSHTFLRFIPILFATVLLTFSIPTIAVWQQDTPLQCGAQPYDVAVGDVDDDGDMDIVAVNWFTNNITIYQWEGSDWLPPESVNVGTNPTSVTIGDATNDGAADMVITNEADDTITLLEWNDTTSDWEENHAGSLPAVGNQPFQSAIYDYDTDGDKDILVTAYGDGEVTVLNYNAGTWTIADCNASAPGTQDLKMDAGCRDIWIGDHPMGPGIEVITVNENRNNISIARYDSGWVDAIYMPVGKSPKALDVGDLDGDTYADIVVANYHNNNVSIYYWDPAGPGWKPEETVAVGLEPTDVIIADADNDGDNDIVTAEFFPDQISITPREGAGWGTRVSLNVVNGPSAVTVADVDQDGKNDIVAANRDAGKISVLKWVDNTPPTTIGLGTHHIDEDVGSNSTFVDLWAYFDDSENTDDELTFTIHLEPTPADILVGTIANDRYFNVAIGPFGTNVSGTFNYTIRCTDQGLKSTDDKIYIVVDPVNDIPVITMVGDSPVVKGQALQLGGSKGAQEDELFTVDIIAEDADNDTLSYSCNYTHDGWPVIDTNNGNISFLPTNEHVGVIYMQVNVSDNNGTTPGYCVVDLVVHVTNTNDAPELSAVGSVEGDPALPTFTTQEGVLFSITFTASDDDAGDTLIFSDDTSLFDIDSSTGSVAFIPTNDQVGTHSFNITVDDGTDPVSQEFRLTIQNRNEKPGIPFINSPIDNATFKIGQAINFSVDAVSDPDLVHGDVLTYTWSFTTGDTEVGQNVSYTFAEEGRYLVNLTVEDSGKLKSWATVWVNIEGVGELPSADVCLLEHDDTEGDVTTYNAGIADRQVGADTSFDITNIKSRRDGTQLVVTLTIKGTVDPDVMYSVYVITNMYLESEVTYTNTAEGPPTPDLPSDLGYDHLLVATHYENGGLDNAVTTGGTLVFKFDLNELIGVTSFDIFGAAVKADNSTSIWDTAGVVSKDPGYVPPVVDGGDGGNEDKRPSWFWPAIIVLIIVLVALFIFFVVSVIMSILKKKKKDEEIDTSQMDAPPPEAPLVEEPVEDVPPLPDIPQTPPPQPEPAAPAAAAPPPVEAAPPAAELPPMEEVIPPEGLLPPTTAGAPEQEEAIPELAPVQEDDKGDIFDELFTPVETEAAGEEQVDVQLPPEEPAAAAEAPAGLEVECYSCHGIIVADSDERPLLLTCPHCGTESMLEG